MTVAPPATQSWQTAHPLWDHVGRLGELLNLPAVFAHFSSYLSRLQHIDA